MIHLFSQYKCPSYFPTGNRIKALSMKANGTIYQVFHIAKRSWYYSPLRSCHHENFLNRKSLKSGLLILVLKENLGEKIVIPSKAKLLQLCWSEYPLDVPGCHYGTNNWKDKHKKKNTVRLPSTKVQKGASPQNKVDDAKVCSGCTSYVLNSCREIKT